jgi:short-subunit dehydrogenase
VLTLNGLVIIITGAGSGIGAALARAASTAGAKIVLAARRRDRLERTAADCPGQTLIVPADLTLPDHRQDLVRQTLDRFGCIDLLINNAGLGAYGHFLDSDEDQWRRLFEINLFAPVFLTRLVLPHMIERGSGLILNVASIGGLIAHADRVTPYVSSKHAVLGFSRGLAKDLAGTGVRVLAACPHLTDTEFFATSPGAEDMADTLNQYRAYMDTPQDVAQGILDRLDSEQLVIFPTEKPARAYEKQRDLR